MSKNNTLEMLRQIEANINIDINSIRQPLTPSVVLRVVDSKGNVFIDTDSRYPSIEKFYECKVKSPPFFANSDMEVARIGNATLYMAKMNFTHEDETVTLYFMRTITAENKLFSHLLDLMILIDIIGMTLAVGTGYVISRKILNPISTMTKTAQNIAIENMSSRIPTAPVKDELTELAKTFNNMLDRLQVGIAQQQRFVSDASHELRTPATVIKGYSDLLSRWGASDPEILKESIDAINSEAENMQQLIEQLLFLARADQNRQPLKMELFELSSVVADIMNKMELVNTTHTIKLLQNDESIIFGDKVTIRQMLRIFLDNAVKYTPTGGTITLSSVKIDGDKIKISVADNGIGIAPEDQKKVFERFYRVDTSHTKMEISGTGLGLSIAAWIAEQHNFKIELESELEKGTTINVIIPLNSHE